ncbi:MAG: hypothetical protein QME60_01335 [Verrucomicrobiota bacterium]|nr:hypothetical protein [Verrucomicrobiota bacterium]
MYFRLKPPPDAETQSAMAVAAVEQAYVARKVNMQQAKRERLDQKIGKMIEENIRATSSMRTKMKALADFLDGAEEYVDFPFGPEASSSIDIRLATAYLRAMRASIIKSIFSDPARTYVAVPMPGVKREDLNQAETALNWTAEYDCNFNECLKDTIVPAFRDRVALIHGQWARRIEHGCDYRIYASPDEFRADYETPEAAGITEAEHEAILAELIEGNEINVEFEIDFLAQNGPEFTTFPLAKFLWAPLYAQAFEKMRLYGYQYTETPQRFEMLTKLGYYDKGPAEEVKRRASAGAMLDDWDRSRAALEGINVSPEEAAYQLAYLIVSEDIDGDSIPERYVVIWDMEKDKSLRWEAYAVRRNVPCIVPFRLVRRPDGRFLGASLLEDSEKLFREINALHRHRSNQRRLTDSVTLLFPETLKERVDLGAEYAYFVPGRVLYLPDNYMRAEMAPRQLAIQDTSRTNTSLDEEGLLQRMLDFILGVSQGQSGQEAPQDPHAPAAKTAMLLQRSDIRTEDMVGEWQRSVPAATDLLRALYFQNIGSSIAITAGYEGEQERTVPTAVFADPKIKAALKPIKPAISPEVEMQRITAIAVALQRFPFVMQMKPMAVVELWNDFVAASRIERPERFQVQMQPDGVTAMMGGQPVNLEQLVSAIGAGQGALGMGGPGQPGPGMPTGGPPQAAGNMVPPPGMGGPMANGRRR